MGGSATPNWDLWLDTCWGIDADLIGTLPAFAGASNIVVGTNPPFTIQDFLAIFPKFGGVQLMATATSSLGSTILNSVSTTTGIVAGNLVAGPGIPDGATVVSTSADTITLSVSVTQSNSGFTLTVWNQPTIPFVVLQAFITLASASLVQARWLEQWQMAMCWYVAHFATLYAQSDGNPNSTVGQIAAQGISTGITVSKSVGDVSVSYQPLQGLENWAAWNLTTYGQQLATFAKLIGSGPVLLW